MSDTRISLRLKSKVGKRNRISFTNDERKYDIALLKPVLIMFTLFEWKITFSLYILNQTPAQAHARVLKDVRKYAPSKLATKHRCLDAFLFFSSAAVSDQLLRIDKRTEITRSEKRGCWISNRQKSRQSQRKFRQAGEDTANSDEGDRQREADSETQKQRAGIEKRERELWLGKARQPHSDTAFVELV